MAADPEKQLRPTNSRRPTRAPLPKPKHPQEACSQTYPRSGHCLPEISYKQAVSQLQHTDFDIITQCNLIGTASDGFTCDVRLAPKLMTLLSSKGGEVLGGTLLTPAFFSHVNVQ